MYDVQKLTQLIGAPKNDAELNKFFNNLGHEVPQQLPVADDYFHICDFERGSEFVFEDEATFLGEGLLGSGRLNFTSFFLRSEYYKDKDYKPFTGVLPHGLSFNLSQSKVRDLLKEPDIVDDEISLSDSWELDETRITLEYTQNGKHIEQVTIMDAAWFRRFTSEL